jgi:hypothetical protein
MTLAALGVFALSAQGFAGYGADAPPSIVELPVEALLAPPVGFDDNDNIEVVLYGTLPNACYTLGEYTTEIVKETSKVRIRQYAIKNNTGFCAQGAAIPPHMQMEIPFMTEVAIGHLPSGDYDFEYTKMGGGDGSRDLNVAKAESAAVDTKPYAAVWNASVKEILRPDDNLVVTLSGMLNSTCTELDPNVGVKKYPDTFILMPVVTLREDVICAQVLIPFETTVNLGKVDPGHYLVHTRSMSGKSVNRVVRVEAISASR